MSSEFNRDDKIYYPPAYYLRLGFLLSMLLRSPLITTNAANIRHTSAIHTGIPQPENGIAPLPRYAVNPIITGRVTRQITVKYAYDIEVIPAIMHSMSSGNAGNNSMIINKNLPFSLKIRAYFSVLSAPNIQLHSLRPNTLPSMNEISEPITVPITDRTKLHVAP